MTGARTGRVGDSARWRPATARLPRRAAALTAAILIAAGCGSAVTPGLTPSAAPSAAGPTQSSTTAAPSSPQASLSAPALQLVDGGDQPLDEASVLGLVSTPAGFAVVGDAAVPGDRLPFVVTGSADARTWIRADTAPAGPAFGSIAGGPRGWIATSDDRTGPERRTVLWFSADGNAWERVIDQAGMGSASIASSEGNPLAAGPAGFAAAGQTIEDGNSVSAVWTSRDGRTWTEATALHGAEVDQVLVLPTGFLAFSGGCCVGPGKILFSSGGNAWRDVSQDPGSPFAMGDEQVIAIALSSTLVAFRAGPGGVVEEYRGDLDGLAAGGAIAWQQDASTDAAFSGAGVAAIAAGADVVLVLGFDRATLDPISWTSPDGTAWRRTALEATTFGGGVPGLAAASGSAGGSGGSAFAAIAYRADEAGQVRPQVWRSDDGTAWSTAGGDVLGVLPTAASGPCPTTTPTVVDDFLAMAPPLWPACFGGRTLKVRGSVGSCECGGTTRQQATPAWLIDPLGLPDFLLEPAIVQAATGRGGFGVRIDPARPVTVPDVGNRVELTGHFADPAAGTCRVFPAEGAFGPVLPRAQTIALCRQVFVATAIRTLAG